MSNVNVKRTLLYIGVLLAFMLQGVATLKAQPEKFSFYMIQPTAFAEVTAVNPVLRQTANVKGAHVKGTNVLRGALLPIIKSSTKWLNVSFDSKSRNQSAWLLASQARQRKVAAQQTCIMPPIYQVESADGSIGGVIEGPSATYQVRTEGKYRLLPFSVGHAPGSDNYTLQFLVAGANPSYTYVITTSFVTTYTAKDKPSLSLVREEEAGRVVYEALYLDLPRTLADDQVDAYITDYLVNSSDVDFAKVITSAFPAEGLVPQVTVYFKAINGKRYAYTYNASLQPQCANELFKWHFVE